MDEKLKIALDMYLNIYSITLKQISEKLNIPTKEIKKYFKDNNIEITKRGYIPKLFLYLEAMELYKTGNYSIMQLCEIYDLNRISLSKYFKECGIDIKQHPNQKYCEENIFEIIDSEEKAYWLGFLYADGCVSSNRNTIEIGLAVIDKEHLEKFKKFIKSEHKIGLHQGKLGDSYRISIRSDKMKSDLIKLGCTPKKSLTLIFPNENQVPKNLIKHFIRGYFDGDGCISIGKSEYVDLISTIEFLECIKDILLKINIKSTIIPLATKNRDSNNYRLVLTNKQGRKDFLNYIYDNANIYLDRKYEKFLKM